MNLTLELSGRVNLVGVSLSSVKKNEVVKIKVEGQNASHVNPYDASSDYDDNDERWAYPSGSGK